MASRRKSTRLAQNADTTVVPMNTQATPFRDLGNKPAGATNSAQDMDVETKKPQVC